MNGFEWLNQAMQWLGKWVPRLILVKQTHLAVVFRPRGRVQTLVPGLYWYWPITTEVVLVSTRMRSTEVAAQLCGREVVSVAVKYSIRDPQQALLAYDDLFSQLDDRTQAAVSAAYAIDTTNDRIARSVHASLIEQFNPHGVNVFGVDVIQRGRVIPLKNLNDWAQHSKAEL